MTPPADRGSFSRVMRAGSVALGYPDAQWRQDLPLLHATAGAVAGPAQAHLRSFLSAVAGCPAGELQQAFVETFDLRRRCCPYLTYYSCGDTRKRGMALLQFTAAYRAAGFELAGRELPDHLAVLCEFTAAAPNPGWPCSAGTGPGSSCSGRRWPTRRRRGWRSSTPSAPSCPTRRRGTCSAPWTWPQRAAGRRSRARAVRPPEYMGGRL